MARPKGSKNKARTVKASVDYVAVIAEKAAKKEKIESEVATLTANLDDLKTQLKAKKAELKAATKELAKAENKKAAAEAKAAEEAKKGEAEDVLKAYAVRQRSAPQRKELPGRLWHSVAPVHHGDARDRARPSGGRRGKPGRRALGAHSGDRARCSV